MTVGVGTILTVDVPSALATMSHVQTLTLTSTGAAACNTNVGTNQRGSVVVTVRAAANPAMDALTLVVTLTAYITGLVPGQTVTFDVSINCGASLGTITIDFTGAGGPKTFTTTVPHNQSSAITVVPIASTVPPTFTFFTRTTPSFTA